MARPAERCAASRRRGSAAAAARDRERDLQATGLAGAAVRASARSARLAASGHSQFGPLAAGASPQIPARPGGRESQGAGRLRALSARHRCRNRAIGIEYAHRDGDLFAGECRRDSAAGVRFGHSVQVEYERTAAEMRAGAEDAACMLNVDGEFRVIVFTTDCTVFSLKTYP